MRAPTMGSTSTTRMTRTELLRHLKDLGWSDPPEVDVAPTVGSATTEPSPGGGGQSRRDPDGRRPEALPADLLALEQVVSICTRCGLASGRRHTVFGEGDPQARLMFVGEAPGAEEDRTGRPFVGPAGHLLDAMIVAMGLRREQVFIANVLKCRPPGNRDPRGEEAGACAPCLDRQIELIAPRVLVALGKPASQRLTGSDKPMGALRGRWSSYRGVPVLCTYHPAYLLRTPKGKRQAWDDLKQVVARLAS
jgi:uracil-DNA glycosylase family 4